SDIRRQAAESLGEIDPGNQIAIEGLILLIRDPKDDILMRGQAARSLEKIGFGNQTAIEGLIVLIRNSQVDSLMRKEAAESLGKIMGERQMAYVVSILKNCLSYNTYENDYDLFSRCYRIIWDYAKKMTYPQFYEAWFKSIS
ncbi:HEAT repeat domain-containing protein, partial [Nostoc sp. CALU 1950]|uniref:HEAT repeat domain-containing protein n=1 Tax=Nostoc sp. CALU 1950 TaxID=3104321 RepID=UPI003EB9CA32